MQEVLPRLPDTGTERQPIIIDTAQDRKRTSFLKFYIHDSADYFRIELIGELAEMDIAELAGCWLTAKPSLSGRKLALDVRHLNAIDEAGRQWLASMVNQGACYIAGKDRSGSYQICPDWRPGNRHSDRHNSRPKVWRALLRMLSSMRLSVPGVETRAQTNTVNADSVRVTGL
jgi:hypothetical protein